GPARRLNALLLSSINGDLRLPSSRLPQLEKTQNEYQLLMELAERTID
ncbi:7809_t:CDS:2, partial [Scutellospora calospora]